MHCQCFLLIVSIYWHSGHGANPGSLSTNQSTECTVQLLNAPWGQSLWGKYAAYDDNYNKIEPRLVLQKHSSNNSTTKWEYSLPRNSMIIGKCHDTYINTDGANTILSTCGSGQWDPSLTSFCKSCGKSTCKSTCDLMPNNRHVRSYSVYSPNGSELKNLSEAPLKTEIVIRCKEGFSKLNVSTKPVKSTCKLHKTTEKGWYPPLEKCYKICDPLPPTLHLNLESCTHLGVDVNCIGVLLAGTSSFATCQNRYSKRTSEKERSNYIHCDEDGVWWNVPNCVGDTLTKILKIDNDCFYKLSDYHNWSNFTVTDHSGNKIEPLVSNMTSAYLVPVNSTIDVRCKEPFLNLDSDITLVSKCVAGHWQPPLQFICSGCTDDKNCIHTCDVPAYDQSVEHTVYHENGTELKFTPVPNRSKLVSRCSANFSTVNGTNGSVNSTCLPHKNGIVWKPEIPKCFKICDDLPYSRKFHFEYCSTTSVITKNCDRTLVSGSLAIASCARGYHVAGNRRRQSIDVKCNNNGTWTKKLNCIEDCGMVVITIKGGNLLGSEAEIAILGRYAWHVAIFRLDKTPLLICGGTIVSSRMVISAAHCFFDETNGKRLHEGNYEIVVAKQTRNYTNIDNHHTKKYKLKEIIFNEKEYNPNLSGNYGSDIAILVTEKPIKFSQEYVWPACISWSEQPPYKPKEGSVGEVYGWGYNEHGELPENLAFVTIPHISYRDCLMKVKSKHVTQDKFCAGTDKGQGLRLGDSGGGYMEKRDERYYLRGIVSDNDAESNTSISSFTDVSYYMKWIREVKTRLDKETVDDVEDDFSELLLQSVGRIKRDSGVTIPSKNEPVDNRSVEMICQKKRKDSTGWKCRKIALCQFSKHLLASNNYTVCGQEGSTQKICCPYRIDPEEAAEEKCREYSKFRYVNVIGGMKYVQLKLFNTERISNCDGHARPLVTGGEPVQEKECPHMALIGNKEDNEMHTEWVCGGSLISDQYVMSAAHCNDPTNPIIIPTWVLLGQLNRPGHEAKMNKKHPGLFRIVQRINHPQYKPPNQEYDIALFKLERPVPLSSTIRPVCLVLPSGSQPTTNRVLATGWGKTAPDQQESDVLLKVSIDRLQDDECVETYKNETSFPNGFNVKTMICAGSLDEAKDTCQGDSGGPLYSKIKNSDYTCMWFQEGITSLGSSFCGDNTPAVYTRVSSFLSWIQPIVWPAQDLKFA